MKRFAKHQPTRPLKEQGVALITALLVVSLATVLAVALVKHLYFDIRRTENILRLDQAQLFNKNSVEFAIVLISRDWELNNKIDTIEDIDTFNDYAIAISFEGPPVSLELTDLQSCFNLNNLSKTNTDLPRYRAQYLRLLSSLEIDPNLRTSLVDSLIDWIDPDSLNEPQGAEVDYYIGLEKPYQAANTLMTSPSELRLVKGYTDEVVKEVEQYTCVLPDINTGININTANSKMLESIDGLKGHGDAIIEYRDGNLPADATQNNNGNNTGDINAINDAANDINSAEPDRNPFEKIDDFKKYVIDTLKVKDFDPVGLQEYSEYFLVKSKTELGTSNIKLFSIIHRDNVEGKTTLSQQTSGAL